MTFDSTIRPAALALFAAGAVAVAMATPVDRRQAQNPPGGQTGQQQPVFRAGANFVYVDAYPRRDGKVVEGLTPADFDLKEDGVPQAIDSLQFIRVEPEPEATRRDPNNAREMRTLVADPTNRAFVIFLDHLHVSVDGSYSIRAPLVRALDEIIGPTDLFAVSTPNVRPDLLTFGRRTLGVADQLARNWPWGARNSSQPDKTDPGEEWLTACFRMPPGGTSEEQIVSDQDGARVRLDQLLIERRREDRTLTSLEQHVDYLGTLREARTVMVIVTDGWRLFGRSQGLFEQADAGRVAGPEPLVIASGRLRPLSGTEAADPKSCNAELVRLADLDNERRFRDLIARANRSNVSIYPVTPAGLTVFDSPINRQITLGPGRGIENSPLVADRNRVRARIDGLRTLAENTDGIAIVDTNDLDKGLKRIVDDVSAYYLLGYYSTNANADGRYRRIEVKVRAPDVEVKARRGYLAPSAASREASRAAAAAAPEGLPAAADAALGELGRLRGDAELFLRAVPAADVLWVSVELGRTGRGRSWALSGAPVTVDVTTESGDVVGRWTGSINANTRGALASVALGASGSAPWRVTVTVGDGVDRLQDQVPVVPGADTSGVGEALVFRATPAARSPLSPVADHQFRRAERVHVEWPFTAVLDNRTARLLGRDGQPLAVPVTLTERALDGRVRLAADLNLAPLSDGEYLIELTARSGSAEVKRYVAIRVSR